MPSNRVPFSHRGSTQSHDLQDLGALKKDLIVIGLRAGGLASARVQDGGKFRRLPRRRSARLDRNDQHRSCSSGYTAYRDYSQSVPHE